MATVSEVVGAYFAAWNEPDPAARLRMLEAAWADDGVLVSPRAGRIVGRQAVAEHIR